MLRVVLDWAAYLSSSVQELSNGELTAVVREVMQQARLAGPRFT